jgi:hypothetical protein
MTDPGRRSVLCLLTLLLLPLSLGTPISAKDEWPPLSPADLALKDNPASPGSHAMILQKEDTMDQTRFEDFKEMVYYRIKIFTEAGKKQANVEIPYFKNYAHIHDIKARTIHPDGKVIEFDGQTFDKTVVKYRTFKYLARTFTLPDVEPGSIIEYRYQISWSDPNAAVNLSGRWPLQEELFMRRAVYSLKPYPESTIHWTGRTMHGEKLQQDHGWIRLEVNDCPGFDTEDYMPPEDELRPHVDFYYSDRGSETTDQFWQRIGKERAEYHEGFIGRRNYVSQIAEQTVAPADPPETKLRKLYARVQQIRNLSFERAKTEKEQKREDIKDNHNVEDVLKHGYGDGGQIDDVFVAMARALGFDSAIVAVARRSRVFFSRDLLNSSQLDDIVASVHLGSEDLYLDPGTKSCPYGILPWALSDTTGLRLDKKNPVFVTISTPKPSDAVIERKAELVLDSEGTLSGKLHVSFGGLQALRRRLDEKDEDDTGKQKDIHDEILGWFPSGSKLDLTSIGSWDGSTEPLRAEGTIRIPGFAMSAGRRILLPVSVVQSGMPKSFQHATRSFPIYFAYPFLEQDDVAIQLPVGIRIETLPAPVQMPAGALEFESSVESKGDALHIQRRFLVKGVFFPVQTYSALRSFFSNVKASDDQQAILQPLQPAKSN